MYKSRQSNKDNNLLNKIENEIVNRQNLHENLRKLKSMNAPYFRPRILSNIGTIYIELGQFNEAMKIFDNLIKEDPSFHTVYKITKLLIGIGDIEKAFYYVSLLDNLEDQDYFNGYINKTIGKYDEAIKYFNKLRFTKREYEGLLQIGHCYRGMKDFESAQKIYNRLLSTEEKDDALVNLIEIGLEKKESDVSKLINRFNLNGCDKRRILTKFKRCFSYYRYLNNQLNKNNLRSYYEEQLMNYDEEKAIEHIIHRHKDWIDYRYNYMPDVDIKKVLDYCKANLKEKKKGGPSDVYIVDYVEDVGNINNIKTNRLLINTVPNTNHILTMFPFANYERMMHKKERNDESVREKV